MARPVRLASLFAVAAVLAAPAHAQTAPQPAGTPEHRAAIDRLDVMDGEWAGPAWSSLPGGGRIDMTQTERVGDLLGGSIKVVEGRAYGADGATSFNAFAVISYDPRTRGYTFTTFVGGEKNEFALSVLDDGGFVWQRQAGPNGVVRFTARIKDGTWHEVGEYIAEGQPPRTIVELNLKRVGDSAWPAAGAVDPSAGR